MSSMGDKGGEPINNKQTRDKEDLTRPWPEGLANFRLAHTDLITQLRSHVTRGGFLFFGRLPSVWSVPSWSSC